MTIFEVIRYDHATLRQILDALSATRGDSPERRHLFARLLEELPGHALAEEQSLYSALMGWPELTEYCRQHVIQHAEADEIIQDLEWEDMSHPAWRIKFYRLRHCLEQHMEEEERQMLPRARQLLSSRQANYLGEVYRSRKRGYREVA